MSEQRLDELEARYSLLEQTLHELSDVVWRQQQELDRLRELADRLIQRLGTEPGLVDANRFDRPPHY